MPDYPLLAKARAGKKGKRKRKAASREKRENTKQQKRVSGAQNSGKQPG